MGVENWFQRASGLLIPQMNFGKRLIGAAACCCGTGESCQHCLGGTPAAWDLTFTGADDNVAVLAIDVDYEVVGTVHVVVFGG